MQRRHNFQLPMKHETRKDGNLQVFKIWQTIQGEGPFVGTPAVFVRLYGCNLMCKGCDTDYTSTMVELEPETLAAEVKKILPPSKLVVITGGEPFRQNIVPFMFELVDVNERMKPNGIRVQIETNGTMHQHLPMIDNFTIVCSPKTSEIEDRIRVKITHLKYILSAIEVDPADGLPTSVLGANVRPCRPWRSFRGEVYVSPEDTGDAARNAANTQAAINSCLKFGYRLSIQTHKIIGVE